jgi:oligopeptide/dipeptide ABC transporter ATP-binding protein
MDILKVENLKKYYELNPGLLAKILRGHQGKILRAVDDITFNVDENEVLGIAGESGCGKTTAGLMLARLINPSSGKVFYNDQDVSELQGQQIRKFHKEVQFIFQDPYQSLNPRFRAFDIIAEGLRALKICSEDEIESRIIRTLDLVGLKPAEFMFRFPHQMSGGERQRVGISSAIILKPRLVIADEPVSMLDVSIRAGILDLIKNLSRELSFASVFISHELASLASISDRLIIMYLGKIVEIAGAEELVKNPSHPYSKALIAAVPVPDPRHKWRSIDIKGGVTKPIDLPSGCRFRPRCPVAIEICSRENPELKKIGLRHEVACHLYN